MSEQVWFITGASRGMGVEFAQAALRAGHSVVATGRNAAATAKAVGDQDRLLVVALDVTDQDSADDAVQSSIDRFGRIDVLVNNAGSSFKGYFEEMSPAQVEAQLATNLLGPMNVTRAVLPQMRARRSRPCDLDLVGRGAGRVRVLVGVRGVQGRARGLDDGVATGDRSVRDPRNDRQSRLVPHRAGRPGVARVARGGDRRLCRAQCRPAEVVASTRRPPGRRSAQVGRRRRHARGDGPAARSVLRRSRRVRASPDARSPSCRLPSTPSPSCRPR